MAKQKKDVVKVTYTMDKAVSDLIDKYNEISFIPKTKIVEEAVKEYIGRKSNKQIKNTIG